MDNYDRPAPTTQRLRGDAKVCMTVGCVQRARVEVNWDPAVPAVRTARGAEEVRVDELKEVLAANETDDNVHVLKCRIMALAEGLREAIRQLESNVAKSSEYLCRTVISGIEREFGKMRTGQISASIVQRAEMVVDHANRKEQEACDARAEAEELRERLNRVEYFLAVEKRSSDDMIGQLRAELIKIGRCDCIEERDSVGMLSEVIEILREHGEINHVMTRAFVVKSAATMADRIVARTSKDVRQ